MANIILINDQDQDQTLTGVTILVSRGPDGDVEFSVGGGGAVSGGKTIIYALPGGPGQISAENTSASTESAAVALLAENDRSIDANDALTVTWDSTGTWTWDGTQLNGTVTSTKPETGVSYIPQESVATLTNNTTKAFSLSFSWVSAYTVAAGSVLIGDNDAAEGTYSGTLQAGQSITVKITSGVANRRLKAPSQSITISNVVINTDSGSDNPLEDGTLAVTWDSNGTWLSENNTVKGTVISERPDSAEGVYYIPKTSEATITNNTSGSIKLNFSWTSDSKDAAGKVTVEGSVQVGSSDAKIGQYSGTIEAGQSVAVKIESAKAIVMASPPCQNILLSDFAVTTAQSGVFLTATPNGSYTVKTGSGEAKTVSAADENGNFSYDGANYNTNDPANLPVFNFQSTDGITVTYAPESGYEFYLWQSEKDGRSSVLIAETVDGTTVIRPEYGTTISPVFRDPAITPLPIFGVDDSYYYYWDDAMQAAKQSESQTAILYLAYDLPTDKDTAGRYGTYAIADAAGAMTYTIPTGVTLSIRNRLTIPSGVALQAYGSGAWLTVNAKIQVSKT